MTRRRRTTRRSRKGMALLVVLFIVMAIAVIASGFIARSDAALQCGRNFCLRGQADYLAWGGLEHARALVQDPNSLGTLPYERTAQQLDAASRQYYDLTIDSPVEQVPADPNDGVSYVYPVACRAYTLAGGQKQATSLLTADLRADPDGTTVYLSIRRGKAR